MRKVLEVCAFLLLPILLTDVLQARFGLGVVLTVGFGVATMAFAWMAWGELSSTPLRDVTDDDDPNATADRVPELEAGLTAAGFSPWAVVATRAGAGERRHVWWLSADQRTVAEVFVLGGEPYLWLESCEASGFQRGTGSPNPFLPARSEPGRARQVVDSLTVATLLGAHVETGAGIERIPVDRALVLGLNRRVARALTLASLALTALGLGAMGAFSALAVLGGRSLSPSTFFGLLIVALWALGSLGLFPQAYLSALRNVFAVRLRPPAVSRAAGAGASARTAPVALPRAAEPQPPVSEGAAVSRTAILTVLVLASVLLGGLAIGAAMWAPEATVAASG